MDLFTNHSKPSPIGQKHSHCLANYSNSVVIGYPGRKLPCKLVTIVYKRKPLPKSPSFVHVPTRVHGNLLWRKTGFQRFQFINHDSRRSQFERGLAQYDVGLVFKEVITYSDQDKLKFIENIMWGNQVSYLTSQRQLNIRIKLSFCVELAAETIPLASIL